MKFPPPIGIKHEADFLLSEEEYAVNEALLAAMNVPSELLRVKDVAGLTPRHGFMKRSPTIEDVMSTARANTPPDNRMDYSGSYGSYSGTSRPGIGQL